MSSSSSSLSFRFLLLLHISLVYLQLILLILPSIYPFSPKSHYDAWIPRLALGCCWFYWAGAEMLFRTKKGANLMNAVTSAHDQSTSWYNSLAIVTIHLTPIILLAIQGGAGSRVLLPYSYAQFHTQSTWYLAPFAVILTGIGLRFLAMYTLKDFFSRSLTVFPSHRVVTVGIYSYIRHPGYLANACVLCFSALLISANVLLFVASIVLFAVIWHRRITAEEHMMLTDAQTQEQYRAYCKRVPARLIPYVY